MKKALTLLIFSYVAMIAIVAKADGIPTDLCELTLNGNITIDTDRIEVIAASGQQLVISQAEGVNVDGERLPLSADQRALLENYDQQVRGTLVPLAGIALDGVGIALTTITEMFYALTDGEPSQALADALADVDAKLSQLLSQTPETTHIAADRVTELEALVESLEPIIESSIERAAQTIIADLGNAMVNGDASLLAEISGLMQRMENFGIEMEANVGEKTRMLEARAVSMCPQLRTLALTESRLQQALPQLAVFDLVRPAPAPAI